jgi:hypothetical protein
MSATLHSKTLSLTSCEGQSIVQAMHKPCTMAGGTHLDVRPGLLAERLELVEQHTLRCVGHDLVWCVVVGVVVGAAVVCVGELWL